MKKKLFDVFLSNGRKMQKQLLIMKLSLILMFSAILNVTASVYSQSARVNLELKNANLQEVFQSIQEQTEFDFFYKNDYLPQDRTINKSYSNVKVENVLEEVLSGTGLVYRVLNKNIIITKAENNDLGANSSNGQQQKVITGKVTDENGDPLPGVAVIIKGTSQGAVTNGNGEYTVPNIPDETILVFSFVGMKTISVDVGTKTEINVSLEQETFGIEEVVAVGYGYVNKRDLTGTVSSVSTQKTMDIPNTNILQTLQGSVAGLSVVTPDRPGENPSVQIRGINSLSAGNSPLIVVDGIIYNGSLSDFNVNDIDKIDVLKDASAAAVYGSRSANGVIIITTKMGTSGKPMFNFNAFAGVSNPVYLIPVMDGPGYLQKILDFRQSIGLEADPAKIVDYLDITEAENYKNGKTIDWYDNIVKTGVTQNYNLNISGKTDRTNYYLSGTYYNQEGIVDNDNFERLSLMANFTNKITDWYSVSLKTSFSSMDYSGVQAGLYYGLSPYGTYWEDEAKGIYKEYPFEDPLFTHPMVPTLVDNKDIRNSLLGQVSSEMDIPFVKELKWTLNYATNLRNRNLYNFWNNEHKTGGGNTANGLARKEIYGNYDWTLDNIINYKRMFLKVHSVDATLLYSREYQRYEETVAQANDFFNQALGYNNLGLGKVQQTGSDLQDQNSVAYMARLNYIFKYKYSLTATIRRDGFSGFSKDNKYATFPSVAFAWTATNEGFLSDISWLNLLKIRLSYGENGNQAISRYQTLARISDSQYIFGDGGSPVTSVYLESMANSELGWETTKVNNLGIDFGFFKNRINGGLDIYSSNTYNILLKRNIPATSGYSTVWTNIGKVHNQGFELSLNSVNMNKNDFKWESGFIFSLNRNRIDELLGEDLDGDGKEDDNLANSWFIGKPLGVIYGYETDGIYQLEDTDIPSGFKPGDFRLVDQDGGGEITPEDRVILGSRLPNYTFSISNTLNYKKFSFYFLINSIQGGGKDNYYVGNNISMHDVNNSMSTWTERMNIIDVPYWTPTNPSNEFSRINYMPTRIHPYLEDRSFVRLQDVNIAYNFNSAMLEKIHLKGLRFFVSGKNLYTWSKWTGYDPENSSSIGDFPMLRTLTLGIDLKF
ncbi:TonB-dependent receptor [Draconibacterium sp.]|jgi:TonB-linked SusC/RagA family outer membrane protein